MTLDESQLAAIATACSQRFTIINGGAGAGKTTIIKEIAQRLSDAGEKIELCAFAGKAAARLKEATGFPAATIHRMLQSDSIRFMRGKLIDVTVIVDEASMVSGDIMAEITRRGPKRLILVGDQAQLPPVGKGQPFHDTITLRADLVRTLTTCYRNSEAVYKAATLIRAGKIPSMADDSENEVWRVMHTGGADATHRAILGLVRAGKIDFDHDILLCPRNGDSAGQACAVRSLNQDIVDIVNRPELNEWSDEAQAYEPTARSSRDLVLSDAPDEDGSPIRPGDRVINTKNYSEHDVWNGTTGEVHAVDAEGGIWVRLDTPIVDKAANAKGEASYTDMVLFDKDMRKTLQHAYALTVHKAQGSQYRRVFVVCLGRDAFALLDRSLIYTAVTRTQKECRVLGETGAFIDGIHRVRHKRTVIQELANAESEASE